MEKSVEENPLSSPNHETPKTKELGNKNVYFSSVKSEVEEDKKERDLNLDKQVRVEPYSLVTCVDTNSMGFNVSSESGTIRAHEPPRSSPTPQRIAPTNVNPIGSQPRFPYHYVSTLPDRWQVVSSSGRLDLPIDPTIPSPNELVIDQDHPYISLRQPPCI
ncbi:hypothetical protein EJD97_004172 [Solanum chilense]|uniref:Uncharacterized protein n=1 Tax=Solanum chilense TaxID=4083 RepID=A0A6N2C1N6_SOLCI|nr:hypothetical protein EJD97_004172 [Solanum chilense]